MPTPTYTPLGAITLSSPASNVTFSNIPNTFRDLILVVHHRFSAGSETDVLFNLDNGNNYATVTMRAGAENATFSATYTSNGIKPQNSVGGATASNDFFQVQIMDYAATDRHKTALMRSGNAAASYTQTHATRWLNTAAITSVRCNSPFATYAAGSTFTLYGVAA